MRTQPESTSTMQTIGRVAGEAVLLALMSLAIVGCAKQEKVLEVNTPGGSIEVDKTTHPNGDVEVEVKSDK